MTCISADEHSDVMKALRNKRNTFILSQVSTYPGRPISRMLRTRVVFLHKSSLIYDSLPKFLQLSHFAAVKTCQGYITGVT